MLRVMAEPTASDYLWFAEHFPYLLAGGYCITLVRDLSPVAMLASLGGRAEGTVTGGRKMAVSADKTWTTYNWRRAFVGVTSVGDWTLMVEANGWLGVSPELMAPISIGTTVVSHFRNVNAVDDFCWFQDGDVRLTFAPLSPYNRSGSDPDGLVDVMQQVGFDLSDGEERDYGMRTEAAFALSERITGVRLTRELLESEFVAGTAPVPQSGS